MISNEKEIFESINNSTNRQDIRNIYSLIAEFESKNSNNEVVSSMKKSLFDKGCELFKNQLNPNRFLS